MHARIIIGSFGASAMIQAVNVATGVVLARTLGAEHRGQLAAALLWPALLAAVGTLGLSDAATFHSSRRTYEPRLVVGTSLALAAVLSLPLVIVGALLFPALLSDYGDSTVRAATFMLAFIPLNIAALSLMGVVAGEQRYALFNALRFLVIGASGAGVLALAAAGELTVTSAAVAYLIANALTLAVAAGAVVRRGLPQARLAAARDLLRFGMRAHIGSVTSLMNERLDQLLISLFLVPALLGAYVVAGTLSSLTLLVGTAVAVIALPVIANEADLEARAAAARRAVSLTFAASLLVSVPMVALAPQLIAFFFGESFAAGATPARILLCAAVLLATGRVLGSVLKAVDRPLTASFAELFALVATIAGLAALLPLFGLTGAAAASLIAYSTSAMWMLKRAGDALQVSPLSFLVPRRRALAPALSARTPPPTRAASPGVER